MAVITIAAGITAACKIALAIAAACAAAGIAEVGADILKNYNKSETATEEDKKASNGWLKSYEEKGTTPELWESVKSNLKPNYTATEKEEIDSIQGNYDEGTYESHYDSTLKATNNLTAKAGDFEFSEEETVGELIPGNKDEEEYDKGTGTGLPGTSPTETPEEGIEDKTDENLGTNNISFMEWIEWAKQDQADRWAREDEIRKHVEEREDTAWQRGVEDMRKSGININLVGASPAASGGGITQASGQNLSGVTSQMNVDLEKLQQMIDNAFKGSENDKDRFIDMLGNFISWVALIAAMKK